MRSLVSALLAGGLFGLGIAVSGMANPAKVLNFFDVTGTWDPSLAFVMGGGLITALIGYRFVFARRAAPLFASTFELPTKRSLDGQLLGGAAVFGVGWGIAGFCPGGAIPALSLGYRETPIFVAAMIAGIIAARFAKARLVAPAPA
jgi:uncharacterized membrane protein YedE/YeeE